MLFLRLFHTVWAQKISQRSKQSITIAFVKLNKNEIEKCLQKLQEASRDNEQDIGKLLKETEPFVLFHCELLSLE